MRLPNEQLLPGYNKKLPQGSLPAKAPSIIIRELPSIFNRHRLQNPIIYLQEPGDGCAESAKASG
ncbi:MULTISPECIES: hypothetical protein [Paenibacillus]|uniref:Uncharacterized protein n=1 Tax=Paenibacillus lactis TaxID=228574 RepID=A0ABS4FJR2_9BACL|nr:hypothetical protein [Paenibacillus lactis]MBP1896483.1 hypothetical protein [Paenibacillus lactis]HAG00676.1 hypothetical protein [Paenibacillus lactis]